MHTRHNTHPRDFLEKLDSDSGKAQELLANWAKDRLTIAPPREMSGIPEDIREDMIHDIIVHCIEDGFRRIRIYRDKVNSFQALFFCIARNKIRDRIRQSSRGIRTVDGDLNEDVANPSSQSESMVVIPDLRLSIGIVQKFLSRLDEKCQLLLRLAAEEFKPQELETRLKIPAKKISDDTGYCRKKLLEMLSGAGYDPEELLAPS